MVAVSVVVFGVDAAELLVVTRLVWDFLDLEVFDDVSTMVDGEAVVVWKEEAVLEDVVRASVTVRIAVIFEPILVWKLVVRAFVVCATVVVIDTVEVEALVDVSTAVVG